jgi:hypothetical protein
MRDMSDAEFKRHFRFDKPTVARLAVLLDLGRPNNRGRPLTPEQQLCIALNFFGGGIYTRIAGYCGAVSNTCAWTTINRVTDRLFQLKGQFIRLPTAPEMEQTAQNLFERFGLPRFAFGIDGVITSFEEAPRNCPPGTIKQNFWCRKMKYAINVQAIGNHKRLLLDLNADWQGATNDARIWNNSPVKGVIERQRQYLLAGDSAYPISENLITPYRNAEALHDPTKARFNRKHSALRTVCTENLFGIWKRRWPVTHLLRCSYSRARKTVYATAVLHNVGILWGDEDPNGPEPPPPLVPDINEQFEIVGYDAEPAVVREAGQRLRDHLRLNMQPGRRR